MSAHGYQFEFISDQYTEDIKSKSKHATNTDIIVRPSECVMAESYIKYCDKILDLEVYPDDTWVVTFPKCGTTWSQEMVWLLKNNLDYEKAKATLLVDRFPFMEFESILGPDTPEAFVHKTIELTESLPRPRCIKSHLPLELLPKKLWTVKPKIVYVARDPRDVAISYYHHCRLFHDYKGNLEDFVEVFLHDRIMYAPFWKHVLDFMDIQDKSHILFNTYEEMKKDLAGVIRKTAKFLNVAITDQQVEELKEHLSFNKMKDNDSVNYSHLDGEIKKDRPDGNDENLRFIRKGVSGGWRNALKPEILEKFTKWNDQYLKGRNLTEYPYNAIQYPEN